MNYSNNNIKQTQKNLSSPKNKLGTKSIVLGFKILIIIVAIMAVSVSCLVFGIINGILDTAPSITLNDVTPSQYKTTVYDCNGIQTETLVASGANRIYVTIDEIPLHLQNAFIAIEDERFYKHNGIDARGIIRAAYIGITSGFNFSQGASTITQQLIKNSVFEVQDENGLLDRLKRKIQEQYLALTLEEEVNDKSAILENYLNTINLGNNNLGVQSASLNYFNKDVSELTLSESAVIAAITQNPSYYNPIRFPEHNAERRGLVLSNMLEQGLIDEAEYNEAVADDVYARIQNVSSASTGSSAYSYYTDALIQQIMEDLMTIKGYTYTQAYNLVYRGGLSIYSCENSQLQEYAEDLINNPDMWNGYLYYSLTYRLQIRDSDDDLHSYTESTMLQYLQSVYGSSFENLYSSIEEAERYIAEYKEYVLTSTGGTEIENGESITYTLEPQVSLSVIENDTGYVRVIIGGRGDKTESLILNRATSSVRQAGSTIKPLAVYAPAIDNNNYTLSSVIDDVPYYYSNGQLVNNNDGLYKGYVTLRQALAESRNVPAVKTLADIGITTGVTYLQNFGISTLTENDYYLPLALGTSSVTNFEMTTAYTVFANEGKYVEPKLYTQIIDHDGNVILDNTNITSTQVIKESTAWLMTDALHSVVTDGTLAGINTGGMYVSAKSGTTQNNYDKWVIGYTSNFTAGIWTGFDNNKEYDVNRTTCYIDIWNLVLQKANEGIDVSSAPEVPSDIVRVQVCCDSGLLPVDGLCDSDERGSRVITEYFVSGTEPTSSCNIHQRVAICSGSNMIASSYCPSSLIENKIRVYKDLSGISLTTFSIQDYPYAITNSTLNSTCTTHSSGSSSNSTSNNSSNNSSGGSRGTQ